MNDEGAVVHMEQAIKDKLAAVPRVTSVALSSVLTMTGDGWHDPLYATGQGVCRIAASAAAPLQVRVARAP